MFWVAGELFGLRFSPVADGSIPVLPPDVRVWEVTTRRASTSASGTSTVRPPRQELRRVDERVPGGSRGWKEMSGHRLQQRQLREGEAGEPILIQLGRRADALPRFGHALHGLNSSVFYPSLAGRRRPAITSSPLAAPRALAGDAGGARPIAADRSARPPGEVELFMSTSVRKVLDRGETLLKVLLRSVLLHQPGRDGPCPSGSEAANRSSTAPSPANARELRGELDLIAGGTAVPPARIEDAGIEPVQAVAELWKSRRASSQLIRTRLARLPLHDVGRLLETMTGTSPCQPATAAGHSFIHAPEFCRGPGVRSKYQRPTCLPCAVGYSQDTHVGVVRPDRPVGDQARKRSRRTASPATPEHALAQLLQLEISAFTSFWSRVVPRLAHLLGIEAVVPGAIGLPPSPVGDGLHCRPPSWTRATAGFHTASIKATAPLPAVFAIWSSSRTWRASGSRGASAPPGPSCRISGDGPVVSCLVAVVAAHDEHAPHPSRAGRGGSE